MVWEVYRDLKRELAEEKEEFGVAEDELVGVEGMLLVDEGQDAVILAAVLGADSTLPGLKLGT